MIFKKRKDEMSDRERVSGSSFLQIVDNASVYYIQQPDVPKQFLIIC